MATPDFKQGPRVEDRSASKRKLLSDPLCRSCADRAVNCHHLIGRGIGGSDVLENLIPLCGSGSERCHGALHGNPWTRNGVRIDAKEVRLRIGLSVRYDEWLYVVVFHGGSATAANEYMRRVYGAEVDHIERLINRRSVVVMRPWTPL